MNRVVSLCLLCAGILGACAAAQVGASGQPTDAQEADLIAQVKNIPASKLDKRLPATSLADWLQAQVGSETKVNWAFRYQDTAGTSPGHDFPDCVEADVMMKDRRSIVVVVALGSPTKHRPFVFSVQMITAKGESAELDRLSDLARLIGKTTQNPRHSEGEK